MARHKDRIGTSGGESLQQDNPFAALSGAGLPAGPAPAEPAPAPPRPAPFGTLVLRRLKAGKGGKVVTEISGLTGPEAELDGLLSSLRKRLGLGGTRKERVLELQGECREALKPLLEAEGYRVKGAG